jgi:hypothetical protein
MTPEQFIAKWQAADLKERAAAQSHFNDLCELLGNPTPTDADPKGEWYCFERGGGRLEARVRARPPVFERLLAPFPRPDTSSSPAAAPSTRRPV